MADWSIWKALDEWRSRRHELAPLFAKAGIAPDVESAVNMVCVNLRRQAPTPPLVTGDKTRDEETLSLYYAGFFRHYDDSLNRAEALLHLAWVPETAPYAERIRAEIARYRQALHEHPGKVPTVDALEKMLRHYVQLDAPELASLSAVLAERRRQLLEIAGYPLLVQHALADPYDDSVPPLTSEDFRQALSSKMQQYRDTPWLHNRVLTNAYVALALDMAHAHKKRDALDDTRVAQLLRHRWPSLSVLLPGFEHADQIWYLLLTVLTLVSIFLELWWAAAPLLVWLHLSLGAHRREKQEIEIKRNQLIARMQSMKRTRDRFVGGGLSLEKLAFQLRQLDEQGEYFDEIVYTLAGLHQQEI